MSMPLSGPERAFGMNFELQQVLLETMQQQMSWEVFESDAFERLKALPRVALEGALKTDSWVDTLDCSFVPSLKPILGRSRTVQTLSLAVINHQATSESPQIKAYLAAYIDIGELDNNGVIDPWLDVQLDDAELIATHANRLISAKKEGLLPNLTPNLLSILNPSHPATARR